MNLWIQYLFHFYWIMFHLAKAICFTWICNMFHLLALSEKKNKTLKKKKFNKSTFTFLCKDSISMHSRLHHVWVKLTYQASQQQIQRLIRRRNCLEYLFDMNINITLDLRLSRLSAVLWNPKMHQPTIASSKVGAPPQGHDAWSKN